MRFEIITIFPEFFTSIFENGILRRALAEGLVSVGVHDLRALTHDRHRTVDDRPFGGGEGMVLKPEPLAEALASLGVEPKGGRCASDVAAAEVNTSGAKAHTNSGAIAARLKSCSVTEPGISTNDEAPRNSASADQGHSPRPIDSKDTKVILLSAQG